MGVVRTTFLFLRLLTTDRFSIARVPEPGDRWSAVANGASCLHDPPRLDNVWDVRPCPSPRLEVISSDSDHCSISL